MQHDDKRAWLLQRRRHKGEHPQVSGIAAETLHLRQRALQSAAQADAMHRPTGRLGKATQEFDMFSERQLRPPW